MTGYEEQLLTRAEVLEDTGELVQAVTAVLAGAQRAGVDPAAVTSLAAAARALDPGVGTRYDAGSKTNRHPGAGYRSDADMLEAVSAAEEDARERLREIQQLQEQVMAAADAAQAALEAAYAMPVKDECDGCHGMKEAAIQDALRRIEVCEAGTGILESLSAPLTTVLVKLRQVPHDLGEVYELVYAFIRKGGKLPVYARWIEGAGQASDREHGRLDHPAGRGLRRCDRRADLPVGELAARAEAGLSASPQDQAEAAASRKVTIRLRTALSGGKMGRREGLKGQYLTEYRKLATGGVPDSWYVTGVTLAARQAVGQWRTAESVTQRLSDLAI